METDGGDEHDSPNSRHSPSFRDSAVGGGGGGDGQLSHAAQTLLDIIRVEGGRSDESRKTWRHFKDKIKSQGKASAGRGSTGTSTVPVPVPASDIPISNNKPWIARRPSTRVNTPLDVDPAIQPDIAVVSDSRGQMLLRNPSRPSERVSGRFDPDDLMKRLQREEEEEEETDDEKEDDDTAEEGGKAGEEDGEEKGPVRMSLMSLLAEMDEDGIGYKMDDDEDDEEDDDGFETNCCICMVRHNGKAFEPCGHSFCRLCSKEMWVQGGNCPLCNSYILKILDIF